MPLLKNAKKALRVSKRKNLVNQQIKSKMKTAVDAIKANPSQENLNKAYEAIDMAAKRNIIHHNKAARHKSQLAKLLASAGVVAPKAAKATKKAASKTTAKK
jgi:small subunit ribosomal protein S20